jgi:hypothetical protein
MVYPGFMDDQPTGRGVYVVRRILAVLVLLLLLALLVPQAYQALLGPREETGSGLQESPEMGGSGNDGNYEEGASNGVAGSVADEVAKQDDDPGNSSHNGETGLSDSVVGTSRGLETSEDVYRGEESVETDAVLIGMVDVFEELAVGEVDQTVPTPVVDAYGQQASQPISSAEPMATVDLLASTEPTIVEGAIFPSYPTYYDYPIYYEDPYLVYHEYPTYYDYAAYYEDPAYYDYAAYYEEQVFVEADTLDTYYDTAVVTAASAQADGGATAYAAAGGGAYAAISMG